MTNRQEGIFAIIAALFVLFSAMLVLNLKDEEQKVEKKMFHQELEYMYLKRHNKRRTVHFCLFSTILQFGA